MMPARAALPPYAQRIVAARQRREVVNLFLYAGHRAWDLAARKPHAVVVTENWQRQDWRWLGGLAATLVARGWSDDDVAALAQCLVRAGSPLVVALQVTPDGRLDRVTPVHYRARRVAP